jgi:signal transduction histidine kinase
VKQNTEGGFSIQIKPVFLPKIKTNQQTNNTRLIYLTKRAAFYTIAQLTLIYAFIRMKSILIGCCLFLIPFIAFSQPIIELTTSDTSLLAGKMCTLKAVGGNPQTIEQIIQTTDFQSNTSEQLLLGVDKMKDVWLKFSIQNTQSEFAFLELTYPLVDTAILYIVENGQVIEQMQSGENYPFKNRFVESKNIIFKIRESATPLTYYINVKTRWFCNIKPRISTIKNFTRATHYDDLIQGAFMGTALVFVLYNLFLFIQLRNSVYIYYSLYLFCISFFVVRHNGFAAEFLLRYTPQYNDLGFTMTGFASVFGTLFTMNFLETKRYLPKLHIFFRCYLVVSIIYTIALFAKEMYWTGVASQTIIPLGTIFVFIASLISWYKGNSSSKYYFFGWITLFICQILFIGENRGALPSNIFTTYASHFGIAFEAFVLSYAIAARFRMVKQEQKSTEVAMIDVMKINEQLMQEKNRLLEQKVEERNAALQNALVKVDTSEEKLQDYANRLEKSNRELTEFAHIASHDLKAPIRGIISFAQLFERRNNTKFDEVDKEYFGYIKNNAFHSAQLIDDVLNYSKIDKNLDEPVEIDINKSIDIIKMNINSLIQEKNGEIKAINLPTIMGHKSLIVQLFQNLIGNGLKYNKSEKATVTISSDANNHGEIVFCVADNGIGIAPEYHEKVFAMFRRLHAQSEYEGSGIGLAFCARIVTTYGGEMWLDSDVGRGTKVFFTLPKAFISSN